MSASDLPWFKVWGNVVSHRKTLALQDELSCDSAGWWLICLWEWAKRNAANGRVVSPIAERLVEMGCGWKGKRGRLVAAFVKAGWLDVIPGGLEIHDWNDWQGRVVEQAERDRLAAQERRRQRREAEAAARAAEVDDTPRQPDSDTLRRDPPVYGNAEQERADENPRRATVGRPSGDRRPQEGEEEEDVDVDSARTEAQETENAVPFSGGGDRAHARESSPPPPPADHLDQEAREDYGALEDERAAMFAQMPNPNPPPEWLPRYRSIRQAHENNRTWFIATARRWLESKWAGSRDTPGDLRVFILVRKDGTEIWRDYVAPRPNVVAMPKRKPPANEAERVWQEALELLREDGKHYALTWLERMRAVGIGQDVLELSVPDSYFKAWVEDHYTSMLTEALDRVRAGLRLQMLVPEGESVPIPFAEPLPTQPEAAA